MDIFFHVYLKSGYTHILLKKFKKFRLSGLYEKTNKIYLTLFGDDIEIHSEFLNDLKELYPKIEYAVIANQEFNNEPDTLNMMLKKANEYDKNTPMLYLHTKGVSYGNPLIKKNIDAWVRYLDLYVIKEWEECIKGLEDNDAAGGLYEASNPKHFSGNFWWANSDYLKTLPRLNMGNITKYNRGEFWILSQTDKVYSVKDNPITDRYQNYVMDENDFSSGW
jgi:hypothetical protein